MDFEKYKKIMDRIIFAYDEMEALYKEKQEALINHKDDTLTVIDDKIIAQSQLIRKINEERVQLVNETKLSEVIELCEKDNNPLLESFKNQKIKINKLSKSIVLLEQSNVELIKHGLVMAEKTLNIIVNAIVPSLDQYDSHGQSIENAQLSNISSIEEEV